MSTQTKAVVAIVLAAIFGGGIAVVGKIGLRVVPPFTFTFFSVSYRYPMHGPIYSFGEEREYA